MKNNKDYLFPKDHLFKSFPDKRVLTDFYQNSQDYLYSAGNLVNDTSDMYVSYLDTIANYNVQAVQDIKTLYSLLGDVFLLSGNVKNSYGLNDLAKYIYSNTNIDLNTSTEEIRIQNNPSFSNNFVATSVQPKTVKLLPKIGQQIGRDVYLGSFADSSKNNSVNNITSSLYELDLYSVNKELYFSILIDLGSVKPINNLGFTSSKDNIPYLYIKQVEIGQGTALTPIQIINSGTTTANGYDIINSISGDSANFNIRFDSQICRYIKVDFFYNGYEVEGQQLIYEMFIKSLNMGFYVPQDTGSIVFGPLKINDELVKTSIDCMLTNYVDNVDFSIAVDPNGTYNSLLNSIELNPKSQLSNILNFNNIAVDSINTSDPVKEFYLKVSLKSIQSNLSDVITVNNSSIENYVQRTRVTIGANNRTVIINGANSSLEVLRELKSYSGYSTIFQKGNLFNIYNVVETQQNNTYSSLGFGTGLDLKIGNYTPTADMLVFTRPEKCQIEITEKNVCILEDSYDQYSIDLFSYSQPFIGSVKGSTVLIGTRHIMTPAKDSVFYSLPTSVSGGIYKVVLDDGTSFTVDLSAKMFYSVLETYINVTGTTSMNFSLFDSIGTFVAQAPIRTLDAVKIISLFDVISITTPTVPGFVFNEMYGLVDNGPTDFTLTCDGLVFGTFFTGEVNNIARVVKTELEKDYQNYDLVLKNPKLVNASEFLINGDYKKVFKLSNTCIVKNSLAFDLNTSSINPFVKEVDFINGHDEFTLTTSFQQINNLNLNVIPLSADYAGDELSDIVFDGEDSLFVNRVYSLDELVNPGDWCLINNQGAWAIYLPVGVTTSKIADVIIIYDIQADINSYGLYSMDYKNGIIYTTAPIDSRIKISYLFSNTYAKYEHYQELDPSNYSISAGQVNIKNNAEAQSGDYMILYNTLDSMALNQPINVSPIVKSIALNILTKSEVL